MPEVSVGRSALVREAIDVLDGTLLPIDRIAADIPVPLR